MALIKERQSSGASGGEPPPSKNAKSRTRVAIAVSNPIQHFCPFYRALEETGQIDLRVFFLSPKGSVPFFDRQFGRTVQWQPGLLDGFRSIFLSKTEPATKPEQANALRRLSKELREFRPTILVTYGLATPLSRRALAWAVFHDTRIFYVSDSPGFSKKTGGRELIRKLMLPPVFRQIDAFLTIGDSNHAFYRRMGVKDEALYFCPFTVDEKPLREAAQNRDTNRRVFLEQYALPSESFAVLFVGKLNARKRPKDLIEAMLLIYECGHQNVHLFLAGDGPERTALRSMVTPQIAPYIHFMGFVSVTDLPTLLSSVDLLVQPSEYDPHPLAISEALYCGLPIAASAGVGSIGSTDEVRPGINGFSFDIGDIAKIAECICSLSSDAELHKRFSEASLNISTERDMKTAISGFMAAVTGTGHTGTL